MPGFNNEPPASEFHRYSSWGRTRRPKSITGADGTAVVDVASVAAAKGITDAITTTSKAAPASGVYSTENQRYLHVMATAGSSVSNIFAYSYAFGVWAELVDSSGNSLTVADGEHKIFEIDGIDLVAFNLGADEESVYAACSTF